MSRFTEPTAIEAFATTPVFVDGLHTIDIDRHGIARVTLYAEQREATGDMERIVVARLILPGSVLAEIAARMMAAPTVQATVDLREHSSLPN